MTEPLRKILNLGNRTGGAAYCSSVVHYGWVTTTRLTLRLVSSRKEARCGSIFPLGCSALVRPALARTVLRTVRLWSVRNCVRYGGNHYGPFGDQDTTYFTYDGVHTDSCVHALALPQVVQAYAPRPSGRSF